MYENVIKNYCTALIILSSPIITTIGLCFEAFNAST